MASLIKSRHGREHGLLAFRSSSSHAASSSGSKHASVRGNKPEGRNERSKNENAVLKPWANQPWPLIETLSRTQNSWSTWLLDHHQLKESTILPGFEAALGVPAGTLTMSSTTQTSSSGTISLGTNTTTTTTTLIKGKGKVDYGGEEDEDTISFLLHRVYAYASATRNNPEVYDATTLEGLLVALAQILVPHLTSQIGLLASMRDMCLSLPSKKKEKDLPEPLPLPMAKITKATKASHAVASNVKSLSPASVSPPTSPSSSTFSTTSPPASSSSSSSSTSSAHSPPSHKKTSSNANLESASGGTHTDDNDDDDSKHASNDHPGAQNLETIDREAKDRLARARALLEADERANKLTQVYTAAETRAAASMDSFVIPPMIVRLRDATSSTSLSSSSSFSPMSSSHHSRAGSRNSGLSFGTGMGTGGMGGLTTNVGGGNKGDWPRFSVPAIHAIADKLSARHEGAWRFLPCDVWGRPRELPFLGD
ncbi:hypothetical protein NPX13_g3534 [Xylaria arbuscula]|uniref:Uncharacterized protein n=1 Tax=Xylaria arbuscula TaxID=114810 RepID=A0A9W8NI97_9PEZI|nr:hypothetical protein NPX13_g3534 [Xylaria arbuscula]